MFASLLPFTFTSTGFFSAQVYVWLTALGRFSGLAAWPTASGTGASSDRSMRISPRKEISTL